MWHTKNRSSNTGQTKEIPMMIRKRDFGTTGIQEKQRATSLDKNRRMKDFRGMSKRKFKKKKKSFLFENNEIHTSLL